MLTTPCDAAPCGRGLVAAFDIRAGDVVYEARPGSFVTTLDLAFSSTVCLYCGDISCGEEGWGDFPSQPFQCEQCCAACWYASIRSRFLVMALLNCPGARPNAEKRGLLCIL